MLIGTEGYGGGLNGVCGSCGDVRPHVSTM